MALIHVAIVVFATALPDGKSVLWGPSFPDRETCIHEAKETGYPMMAKRTKLPDHKIFCVSVASLTEEQKENPEKITELKQEDYVPPE
jgi:hypothetical protein